MVKKVSGGKRPGSGTTPVEGSKPIESAKVGDVNQVKETSKQGGSSKVAQQGRPLTAADRDRIMKMVEEEAEKMFGKSGLSEAKRKKVENAVRMTVDAAIQGEEEN